MDRELYVMPFDHRGSFQEKLFGIKGRPPSEDETKAIAGYKKMVYDGFLKALEMGVPKEKAAILVDEQFGEAVARDAKVNGITLCMPVEKSGQDEFDFDYEDFYQQHIEDFSPDYVKVLVRYNTEGDRHMNERQAERLQMLSSYCWEAKRKLLFELLVPATAAQMLAVNEDKKRYEAEMRPRLMVEAIQELHLAGIEPVVWKLEGLSKREDYEAVVRQAQHDGRDAGIIILGRGEDAESVKKWMKTGANVEGVIGFAVGRTVFLNALQQYKAGAYAREQVVDEIARNYKGFCDLFAEARRK